jgi:hypothetical protein
MVRQALAIAEIKLLARFARAAECLCIYPLVYTFYLTVVSDAAWAWSQMIKVLQAFSVGGMHVKFLTHRQTLLLIHVFVTCRQTNFTDHCIYSHD